MANNNRKIKVNELDFLTIRGNLKNYLSGLDEFTDFNFEGSGTSVLLDLLAYVTHYQGFYNNMVANEMFLDSAVKRTSIVSHAKSLGYVPSSHSAATAVVDITITDDSEATTILSKRTKFTGERDGVRYNFTNQDAETFETLNATQKIARNVTLKEGTWRYHSFVVDNSTDLKRYIIPEKNIDMSSLSVRVQTSLNNTSGYQDLWSNATDITGLTSTSKIYFTQEVEGGQYEVYFGDGILGTKLTDGNVIIFDYLLTNGGKANEVGIKDSSGARTFTSSDAPIIDIAVVSSASGGGGKESGKSIRFNAPKAFQSQNRSVTTDDYKTFILQNYNTASDVFIWGGEDNDPPEYGKVIISVKPRSGTVLSQEEKISLQNILKKQNLVSIIPEIVDPNYIYMKVNVKVSYDTNLTAKSSNDIKQIVDAYVLSYSVNDLEKFSRNFRYSKFVKLIDDSDESILGNDTSIIMQKRIEPIVGEAKTYTIKFANEIYHPHDGHMSVVNTSTFNYTKLNGDVVPSKMDDDGHGKIRIYETINQVKSYINLNAGIIDYTTGIISLKDFMPVSVQGTLLKIDAVPKNKDILSERNSVIQIDLGDSESIKTTVSAYLPYGTTSTSSSTTDTSSTSSSVGY